MANSISPVLQEIILILVSLVLLYIAKLVHDLFTPYKIDEELNKSNLAVTLALTGYFGGITAILIGAVLGASKGLLNDILTFLEYGALGIILMNVSTWVNDKLILYHFPDIHELVDNRNIATGAVYLGTYIASGLIIAGSINGEGGGFITTLVFYLLGQAVLFIFTLLYDLITPHNLQDEIELGNVAIGTAFGGSLIAMGIILMKATMGNFVSWKYNLAQFGIYALAGLIILPIIRFFFDRIMFPKTDLNKALTDDHNISAGIYELVFAVCVVLITFFVLDLTPKV